MDVESVAGASGVGPVTSGTIGSGGADKIAGGIGTAPDGRLVSIAVTPLGALPEPTPPPVTFGGGGIGTSIAFSTGRGLDDGTAFAPAPRFPVRDVPPPVWVPRLAIARHYGAAAAQVTIDTFQNTRNPRPMTQRPPLDYQRPPPPPPRGPYWFTDRLGCLVPTLIAAPFLIYLLIEFRFSPGGGGRNQRVVDWLILTLAVIWCAAVVGIVSLVGATRRESRRRGRAFRDVDPPDADT
jgi:hypothetical protein